MKFKTWISYFEESIPQLSMEEKEKVLIYYKELFEDKIENGFSEEEIVSSFGDAKTVADELVGHLGIVAPIPQSEKEQNEKGTEENNSSNFTSSFLKFQNAFNKKADEFFKKVQKTFSEDANKTKTKKEDTVDTKSSVSTPENKTTQKEVGEIFMKIIKIPLAFILTILLGTLIFISAVFMFVYVVVAASFVIAPIAVFILAFPLSTAYLFTIGQAITVLGLGLILVAVQKASLKFLKLIMTFSSQQIGLLWKGV